MPNLMDNAQFISAPSAQNSMPNLQEVLQRARQDPRGFEEFIRQNNPQGYQQAMQLRNSANPRAAIMQLAQQRGISPNVLRMFGL